MHDELLCNEVTVMFTPILKFYWPSKIGNV